MPSEGRFKSNKPYNKELRTSFNSSWQNHRRNYDLDDRRLKKSEPNRVLRIKCLNALHQVSTETLYSVFSTYGKVLRIVIFYRGESLNAMVEFDKIDAAITAKEYLDGFELFHNSNKLQIEFAWTSRLIVNVNVNTRSWDFTGDDYHYQGQAYAQHLSQPQVAYGGGGGYFMAQPTYEAHVNRNTIEFSHVPRYEANVMMVTGLTYETSNTFKLFNLLSLCGNVAKIQFLHNFPGSAVVQMFDQMSVECCISMLNEAPVGNQSCLKVYWTDQAFQPSHFNSFLMMDGSSSFTDFSDSKNQRFMVPRPTFWIQPPSQIVRFYNTPLDFTVKSIYDMFDEEISQPAKVIFLKIEEDSRSSRGLIEFHSIADAVLAIMKCNNLEVHSSKDRFFVKLCFSSPQTTI